jgi:hypothetical protein
LFDAVLIGAGRRSVAQTAHVNSSPTRYYPLVYTESAGIKAGVQHWRWILNRPTGGAGQGGWEPPEFIPCGESELFEILPSYIKGDAPRDARVKLKLTLGDGMAITKTPTIEELYDPNGEYAPPPSSD